MSLLNILILLAAVFILIFMRCRPLVWVVIFGALLAISTALHFVPLYYLLPFWLIFIVVAAFSLSDTLRVQFITRHLIKGFRQVLPPMSQTEREALEAGQVWWEGELFQGQPDWKKCQAYTHPVLTTEEQTFLDYQVNTLCGMLDDWEATCDADFSEAAWGYLKQERFFGVIIPKVYGGLGFSALMQSTLVARIATRNFSAAVTAMVPNSLGPAELLLHYGTEEQKNYYLPRLAKAEEIPCFALTSTEGGSDAGAMPDEGIICQGMHDGKDVLGIRLNFNKRYITLAPVATVVGLAFKLFDPEHLLGEKENIGITCVLIPANHSGVEIGKRHYPMNTSFMNGPVSGKDVFIPLDWIIGGPEMAGHGWRMLMECLSIGRGISLPALSTAVGQLCYRMTGAYVQLREQFKVPIGQFEGIQEVLAKMAGFTYLLEATRVFTAGAVDADAQPSLASAIAKYHMTEMARKISDIAMDIHAGRGIQAGPRNYLASIYMHIPVAITVEGANILTRNLMIFGQGAVRCHHYVFQEMEALSNKDEKAGLKAFDRLFLSHIGYGLSNFVRAFGLGVVARRGYHAQLTRMSAALALVSDVAMLLLGGDLKRRENLSARLGDVLSYLYLASAALKYSESVEETTESKQHLDWSVQYCLHHAQEAFLGVFANFPKKSLGVLLKWVVFPRGRSYHYPSDYLSQQLATIMMQPSAFRDRLTSLVYIGQQADDPTGRMEQAWEMLWTVAPLFEKIREAVFKKLIPRRLKRKDKLVACEKQGVLTKEEIKRLNAFEKCRLDTLEVDEFPKAFFSKK